MSHSNYDSYIYFCSGAQHSSSTFAALSLFVVCCCDTLHGPRTPRYRVRSFMAPFIKW